MSRARIRAWVEARRDEIIAFLSDLIATDSVTGNEGPVAELCARWLRAHGIAVTLAPAKDRHNVIGCVGAGEEALIYSGHLDTVPPNRGSWRFGPFTPALEAGRVYGLGASDMLGSLAAAFFALLYLAEVPLPGRVLGVFTIEEETTGDGTRLFLEWAEREGLIDFARTSAVVTEPTGLAEVCLGNRGSSFVVIDVRGHGGHGSRPHLARNPIPKVLEIIADLARLEEEWRAPHSDAEFGAPTMTPTSVRAGDIDATNVIPELAQAVIDCRLTPSLWADGLAPFRAALGARLERHREEGFAIEWRELYPREGHRLERDHALARTVLAALRDDVGVEGAAATTTAAGNDAVYFGERSIPTINKVGPGHPECAHRIDEHISIENLLRGVELYIWIALRHYGAAPR